MAPVACTRHLPEFALRLVRVRARKLARQHIIPAYERKDIEQHLLCEVWGRWRRFDGSRGRLPGFVVRVIDNAIADLIGRHAVHRRIGPLRFVSLHDVVRDDDGSIATVGDRLPEDLALWPVASNQLGAADLRVDLERTVARLPSRLQDLCRRLSSQPIAHIARETGASRSSIYVSVATIRRSFVEAGLHLYLAEGPAHSRAAR